MKFNELSIDDSIKKAIQDLNFSEMTEVQEKAIPLAMKGEDLIVRSQTGTGKTAAFGVSLLSINKKSLVIAPTRELALQIYKNIKDLAKYKTLRIVVVYGGAPIQKQEFLLKKGADILIATPGRLIDHHERGNLSLEEFEVVVLDEADRMLDMGFVEDIKSIIEKTNLKQLLLFSATLNDEIFGVVREFSNPKVLEIGEEEKSPTIEEKIISSSKGKLRKLIHLLKSKEGKKIIFLSTRNSVENLNSLLRERGFKTTYIHGGLKQGRREKSLYLFKKGVVDILIATDVASRGLHIDNVDVVINYHAPNDEKVAIHRMGRTGRMGKKGEVFTFS